MVSAPEGERADAVAPTVRQRWSGPVFVTGMPRSGTTMLASMLDTHSEVAIAPEFHYFTEHWPVCRSALRADGQGPAELVRHLLPTALADLRLTDEESGRLVDVAGESRDHAGVYMAILATYAARRAKSVAGEKTPAYQLQVPLLHRLFPDLRLISIVRDPRDVSASWQGANWNGGGLYHAMVWRRFEKAAREAEALLGDAMLRVRYEDVVVNPAESLARCCAHLGVPYEPGMLDFHRAREKNFDARREPWKRKANEPVDAQNVGKWVNSLTPPDVALIERVNRADMARLGYARSRPRLSPGAVLRATGDALRDVQRTVRNDRETSGSLAWLNLDA